MARDCGGLLEQHLVIEQIEGEWPDADRQAIRGTPQPMYQHAVRGGRDRRQSQVHPESRGARGDRGEVVSTNTITRFEGGDPLKGRTLDAIRDVFIVAGVEFIPENGGGAGVRLRKGGA